MAQRPIAKDQPASFTFSPENESWCQSQLGKYARPESCVVPFLWRAQEQAGWLSIAAIETVAKKLSMPYMRVYEVASFYTMFNMAPVGRYFFQLCGTTPCMLRESGALAEILREEIGEQAQVTADGLFSWIEVECLGACVNAPVIQVNADYIEDVTPEGLKSFIAACRRGENPQSYSMQSERFRSAPTGGSALLRDENALERRYDKLARPASESREKG